MMVDGQTECWCGNQNLEAFSDQYDRCTACETLIDRADPTQPDPRVRDDASDFYGWEYFHKRQAADNYPSLETRMRTDLPERCMFWLEALTQYKLPGSKVLEIGSAHGAFVGLLKQAGYDATGLDLSPAIVELSRKTFDVPMLLGPLEDQSIDAGSLDAIVMMDVVEHLPDPRGTVARCLELLKPDGVLMIQTPCYPAGVSLDRLEQTRDRFVQHFKPGEHLQLFSQPSMLKLFQSCGARHVQFLPPIFWFYDLFVVASRTPLIETTVESRDAAFQSSVQGRFVQAMLDGERRFRDLLGKHRALINENAIIRRELGKSFDPSRLKMSA